MAKLRNLTAARPIRPSSIEGIFVLPITFAKVDEMRSTFDAMSEDDEDDSQKVMLWAFQNLFCDEDGQPFEDVLTEEDVAQIDVGVSQQLMEDIKACVAPPKSEGQPESS